LVFGASSNQADLGASWTNYLLDGFLYCQWLWSKSLILMLVH